MQDRFYNIDEQRRWNEDYMWENDGHEWSHMFGNTDNLWNKQIFPHIKEFRGRKVVEIAPGRGRITQYLSILTSELTVVDLNPTCIDITRNKLGEHVKSYIVNDGKSLPGILSNSQDLVISWDSFVHMHRNVIDDYLKEISRVLVEGGKGYIHHSWLWDGSEYSTNNISGRSNMTPHLFAEMVTSHGMKMVNQFNLTFPEVTDTVSIFTK